MRSKLFASIVLVFVMMLSMGMSAFAAGEDLTSTISLPAGDIKAVGKVIQDLEKDKKLEIELKPNSATTTTKIITADAKGLKFNNTAFESGTEKSRKAALKAFVTGIQDSPIQQQSQQQIMDDLALVNSDVSRLLIPMVMDSTSADLFTAMKWLAPILPIIRVIFGVGAILITIFLIGSTIVDLCFIGLPIAREGLQSRGDANGNGGGSGKVPFVSADAVSVIKETESALDSSGGYKNAYVMYFKRRVLTYIIISICLLYLVLGELGGLIGWILGLGDGIVGGS